jgi:DNA-binding transcriptional MocR family regulator
MAENVQLQSAMELPQPCINLLRGWPNPALLPVCLIRDAATSTFSDPRTFVSGLLYGPDPGDDHVREHIAAWLDDFYQPQIPIEPGRIAVTGGASQSLGTIMQVYSDPHYTQYVWFVVPSYMLAFRIMEDAGFAGKLRSVPEDGQGIDVDYLEKELSKSETELATSGITQSAIALKPEREYRKLYRHVIFTVPTFSNPSSTTVSMKRREQLVRLARRFDALIICDDVYDFLQWPTDPSSSHTSMNKASISRIVDVDRFLDGGTGRVGADGFGNVVSNGTFSKIVAPGLRAGWVESSTKFVFGVSQA